MGEKAQPLKEIYYSKNSDCYCHARENKENKFIDLVNNIFITILSIFYLIYWCIKVILNKII